jgi:hypothetical protein
MTAKSLLFTNEPPSIASYPYNGSPDPKTHTFNKRPRLSETTSPFKPAITAEPQIQASKLSFSALAPYVFFNVPSHPVSRSFSCR